MTEAEYIATVDLNPTKEKIRKYREVWRMIQAYRNTVLECEQLSIIPKTWIVFRERLEANCKKLRVKYSDALYDQAIAEMRRVC